MITITLIDGTKISGNRDDVIYAYKRIMNANSNKLSTHPLPDDYDAYPLPDDYPMPEWQPGIDATWSTSTSTDTKGKFTQ